MATVTLESRAGALLADLAGPDATFRPHQLEAVRDLVEDRARVLCVQRTGWGKSAVYFIATALLRERGAGPASSRRNSAARSSMAAAVVVVTATTVGHRPVPTAEPAHMVQFRGRDGTCLRLSPAVP